MAAIQDPPSEANLEQMCDELMLRKDLDKLQAVDQLSYPWYYHRRLRMTATDIASLLYADDDEYLVSQDSKIRNLIKEKTDPVASKFKLLEINSNNAGRNRGRSAEPDGTKLYRSLMFGKDYAVQTYVTGMYIDDENPFISASPDRLVLLTKTNLPAPSYYGSRDSKLLPIQLEGDRTVPLVELTRSVVEAKQILSEQGKWGKVEPEDKKQAEEEEGEARPLQPPSIAEDQAKREIEANKSELEKRLDRYSKVQMKLGLLELKYRQCHTLKVTPRMRTQVIIQLAASGLKWCDVLIWRKVDETRYGTKFQYKLQRVKWDARVQEEYYNVILPQMRDLYINKLGPQILANKDWILDKTKDPIFQQYSFVSSGTEYDVVPKGNVRSAMAQAAAATKPPAAQRRLRSSRGCFAPRRSMVGMRQQPAMCLRM